MNLCKCGCGKEVTKNTNKYINGHNSGTKENNQKIKETSQKHFKTNHPSQSKIFKDKFAQTCLKKFGSTTNLKCQDTKNKIKQTCLVKYGVDNPAKFLPLIKQFTKKCKETRTRLGHWIPDSQKSKWQLYRHKVFRCTYVSAIKKFTKEELKKRKSSGKENGFHIDHKFSVLEGFNQSIDPVIIGSQCNIELIPWQDNNKKWAKCSITKEELFKLYQIEKINEEQK